MKTILAAAAFSVLLASCGGGRVPSAQTPSPSAHTPSPSASPSVSPTSPAPSSSGSVAPSRSPRQPGDCVTWMQTAAHTAPAETQAAKAIVYSFDGELYMWTATGGAWGLTHDAVIQCLPRFIDETTISYVVRDGLFRLDLRTGVRTLLTRAPGTIWTYAWNETRTLVAFLAGAEPASANLYLVGSDAPAYRRIRAFKPGGGRCAGWPDEMTIAWSPAGDVVAVTHTALNPGAEEATAFVIDLRGNDVIAPRRAEQTRWLSATELLVVEDGILYSVTVPGGVRTRIVGATHAADDVAVSPGATGIAYTGYSGEMPEVWLFDRTSRTERRLGTMMFAPVWVGPGVLVATTARGGTGETASVWDPAGRTVRIDAATTTAAPHPIQSTADADAFYV